MAERHRIATYFAPLAASEPGAFSLTDDAAQLDVPPDQSLIVTTDSVIENIHVMTGATAQQFAQKLVRRNLSDLAAMGAKPWRYLINLHTPPNLPDAWFAEFSQTLAREQQHFGMTLIGGDSTSGGEAIHTTMTCIGLLDGTALRRNGAHIGDDVYVSGTVGDAALGLQLLQRSIAAAISDDAAAFLIDRYHLPQPRLALGAALKNIATACIDVSDGLLADAQQLAAASGVGISLQRDAIPLSAAAHKMLKQNTDLWEPILTGGDDYELLFTAPFFARERIAALAQTLGLPLTRMGEVIAGAQVHILDGHGTPMTLTKSGFAHG